MCRRPQGPDRPRRLEGELDLIVPASLVSHNSRIIRVIGYDFGWEGCVEG